MAKIFLNDGRSVVFPDGLSDDQADSMADLAEKGMPLPKGVTVESAAPMQQAQATQAPTPIHTISQTIGPPLAAVRDAVTSGVSGLAQGVAGMAPEAMPLQDPVQQRVVAQQAGAAMAGAVVPQNLPQLASAVVMTAMGGPMAGPTVGGAIARTFFPGAAAALVQGLMEGSAQAGLESPEFYASVLGGLAAEGVPGLVRIVRKFKIGTDAWDKVGDQWAKDLGNSVAGVTSVKSMQQATPETFRHMLAEPERGKTLFHQEMSKAIEESEKGISRAIVPTLAALPEPQRRSAVRLLETAADYQPPRARAAGPTDAPLSREPVVMPDTMFSKAIERARLVRQEAASLDGAQRWEAFQRYGAIKRDIETALTTINPAMAQQYNAMNEQYAKDIYVQDILWRMKKEEAWTTASDRTHLNVGKVADILMDSDAGLDKSGLMGGSAGALAYMAGPSKQPGARPKTLEQYIRVFQGVPGVGAAASLAAHVPVMTMPQAPVSAAHVKALNDYLAASLIRPMITPEKTGAQ
jgi:hypothetical protein